ncbi:hypothetical protein EVAR_80474_1 [Eumeta japonica]|uniref:Uncharacterized protein n=1 Tax=Eumeta variegata TaxID=151549 RepID=A0A4C1YKN0_EUMVA|nr:hypothetical protein EVAR_80474_1 [Eumeta japonica]
MRVHALAQAVVSVGVDSGAFGRDGQTRILKLGLSLATELLASLAGADYRRLRLIGHGATPFVTAGNPLELRSQYF